MFGVDKFWFQRSPKKSTNYKELRKQKQLGSTTRAEEQNDLIFISVSDFSNLGHQTHPGVVAPDHQPQLPDFKNFLD